MDSFRSKPCKDLIRDKASGIVPIKYEQSSKVALAINESGNLMNSVKDRIVFKQNKSKSADYIKSVKADNEYVIRKKKNIEYF